MRYFKKFSDALRFLIESKLKVNRRVTNYLDDFLFIALSIIRCNAMIQQFLDLCDEIGVPIAVEKTEWASELIVFLGMLLDGRNRIIAIPEEKRQLVIKLLQEMTEKSKKKAMVKDLQKFCGHLNFVSRAIFLGRTFTRCMYSKFSKVVNLNGAPKDAYHYKLKQHHHV